MPDLQLRRGTVLRVASTGQQSVSLRQHANETFSSKSSVAELDSGKMFNSTTYLRTSHVAQIRGYQRKGATAQHGDWAWRNSRPRLTLDLHKPPKHKRATQTALRWT